MTVFLKGDSSLDSLFNAWFTEMGRDIKEIASDG